MGGWEVIATGFGVLLGSAGLLVFFVPLIWIISHYSHKVKIERMRLQAQTQGSDAIRNDLEALRQQLQQLRENSSQFALTTDTTLNALRDRMERLEERLSQIEQQNITQRL